MGMLNTISAATRPLQLVNRVMQWCSAVIVLGITSWFINVGARNAHVVYQEVIAAISVVFFVPAFLSPFMQTTLGGVVLFIDVVFSYLWITSFIFSAQDYNRDNCFLNSPPGVRCSIKHANEAFIFLAFIFTFFGLFLEVAGLWGARRDRGAEREKGNGAASATAQHHHPAGDGTTTSGAV